MNAIGDNKGVFTVRPWRDSIFTCFLSNRAFPETNGKKGTMLKLVVVSK